MSIYGCAFLVLCVLCGLLSIGTILPGHWSTVTEGLTAVFGVFFVISLVIGRRFKFDPILR
ncbi:PA3371 family protein [Stutzerimonas zhaodongensis]|uniref:PA3371 family protein n=1 Tax=Stutzerimonas zhaodongensis TaxID=1176257 RepID=UPI002681ECEF